MEALSQSVERLAFEVQRLKENEAHEHEKMALRLEMNLLRFERRLLLARHESDPDEG